MNRRIAHAACTAALAIAVAVVPAGFAAKGGNRGGGATSGTSSISLASPLVYDANGDRAPNHGDVVVFNVSTTATSQPFVNLKCWQNGDLVLDGWNGYFDGALNSTWNFGLGSAAWQSGAADCTAYLAKATKRGTWTVLATTSFHVEP
jgi:hypothetical protein